jgi:hypothetical protein
VAEEAFVGTAFVAPAAEGLPVIAVTDELLFVGVGVLSPVLELVPPVVAPTPPSPFAAAPASWRVICAARPSPPALITPLVKACGNIEESGPLAPPPLEEPSEDPPSSPLSPPRPLLAVSDCESSSTNICSKASAVS